MRVVMLCEYLCVCVCCESLQLFEMIRVVIDLYFIESIGSTTTTTNCLARTHFIGFLINCCALENQTGPGFDGCEPRVFFCSTPAFNNKI